MLSLRMNQRTRYKKARQNERQALGEREGGHVHVCVLLLSTPVCVYLYFPADLPA